MARLSGAISSEDAAFKNDVAALLRSSVVPISVSDERSAREGGAPDFIVVDGRGSEAAATATVERLRSSSPAVFIFVIALEAKPDAILRAMRAGANEFLTWPPDVGAFEEAIQRTVVRHEASPAARKQGTLLTMFGAKGGAGTTTMAVNCAVELARLSQRPTVIVDLQPGLGEVTLFLGVRSRYTILDAFENLHRLDGEFLRELLAKHKSGLDILAGADHFERPSPADSAAIEEVLRLLGRQYEYVIVDAGSHLNACSVAALYNADSVYLVANPDVPSVRNAQRLIDRFGQLGSCGDRVRVLLNRAADPYPIPLSQIEAALGCKIEHTFPSDYKTVSTALNSGVPLALTGDTDIAAQVDRFTRRILAPSTDVSPAPANRRSPVGLQRLASIW